MFTVKLLREAGYDEAALGLSLSYNSPTENMPKRMRALAHIGGGENKFLESMVVWLDVLAPRYWWQEADTYRLATKQSASTMHTIVRRPLTQEDFQDGIDTTILGLINARIALQDFRWIKRHLPESFLQRRVWMLSYKALQNIWHQRRDHRLEEWRTFCIEILKQLGHPEFIEARD